MERKHLVRKETADGCDTSGQSSSTQVKIQLGFPTFSIGTGYTTYRYSAMRSLASALRFLKSYMGYENGGRLNSNYRNCDIF